jgi:hypothetical protein
MTFIKNTGIPAPRQGTLPGRQVSTRVLHTIPRIASQPHTTPTPTGTYLRKGGDFALIYVLVSRQGQEFGELIVGDDFVEQFTGQGKFAGRKLLLAKGGLDLRQFFIRQLPE